MDSLAVVLATVRVDESKGFGPSMASQVPAPLDIGHGGAVILAVAVFARRPHHGMTLQARLLEVDGVAPAFIEAAGIAHRDSFSSALRASMIVVECRVAFADTGWCGNGASKEEG